MSTVSLIKLSSVLGAQSKQYFWLGWFRNESSHHPITEPTDEADIFCAVRVPAQEEGYPPREILSEMNALVPWQRLYEALSPAYYPGSAGRRGRPPIGLERLLRIYFLQPWYALADEALEDAIYDNQAMRHFIGIDLSIESVPDASPLLRIYCRKSMR